jgi:hypothetical protein
MKKAILALLLIIACGVTYADPIPLEPPGGHLIVRNNGTINMAMEEDFEAPIGAIVDIEHGSIN